MTMAHFLREYPEIMKYLGDHLEKSHMQNYHEVVPEEILIEIYLDWIKFYEVNIKQIVENTHKIFEVTHGECGYNALKEKWSDYNGQKTNRFTPQQIEDCFRNNFVATMCHLFQAWKPSKKEMFYKPIHGGACGLLMTVSSDMSFHESEYKGVDYMVNPKLHIKVSLETSHEQNIDIYN